MTDLTIRERELRAECYAAEAQAACRRLILDVVGEMGLIEGNPDPPTPDDMVTLVNNLNVSIHRAKMRLDCIREDNGQ